MNLDTLKLLDQTIKQDEDSVFVKPFCIFFGIDYDNQLKIIKKNYFLQTSVSKKTSMLLFGDKRERLTLQKEGFLVWVLQVKPQIVHPNLTDKLKIVQKNILHYLTNKAKNVEKERKMLQELYFEKESLYTQRKEINVRIKDLDVKIKELATKGIQNVNEIPFPTQKIDYLIENSNS